MDPKTSQPPKWADNLLSWFCKEEVREIVQGDLHEIYHERVAKLGRQRANLLFIRDVFGLLRPRLVKNMDGDYRMNHYGVFKNHLKTSLRNIRHNALFSSINVIGLGVSMSVGVLMIALLTELKTFDAFHEKKERIFRVGTYKKALFQGEAEYHATASHYFAEQIQSQIPGLEKVLVLDRDLTADFRTQNKAISIKGYYSTTSFFDVFSFKLKKGNPKTALENPGAIVLTESAAKRLFGNVEPLDKTITIEGNPDFQTGVITGIMEDPPMSSHLHFETLVSMKTKENSLSQRRRNFKNNPGRYAQSYVYLLLQKDVNASTVENSIASIVAEHNTQHAPISLFVQPMNEFVTKDTGFQPGPAFSTTKINMMIGLAVIVLLSACFNYTNLSLVRALRRSKEVSVRKITGATRFQIFSQFITEAMILSFIAVIVGVGIFYGIKPSYLNLSSLTGGEMFLLDISPTIIAYLILFAFVVGGIAGFFPALSLSSLKPTVLFGGAGKIKIFSGVNVRHVLITCQIALCIGLIMCAVMVRKQYNYALNYDLGYNTENIVNINLKGPYAEILQNEYSKLSEVTETSISSVTLGIRSGNPAEAMLEDRSDTIMFSCSYVDSKYLDMHGFDLIAGTRFTPRENNSQVAMIVNERFLKELNLGTPQDAIGKEVWYFEDMKVKIQGVVKDFVSMSLDADAPTAFGFLNQTINEKPILGVKISGNDWLATMTKLENVYKKIDPVHPFEATFYDDQIARTYEKSRTTYTIASFLGFLAISISTLGLLGLAVFTIETRMKEICIRKVLGAGIRNLTVVLSRGYITMITVAAFTAIPCAFYVVNEMMLNEFLYRAEIESFEILSGLSVVLLIAVIAIGWQVRVATKQNPADLLRNE